MSQAEKILSFYRTLKEPEKLPEDVQTMNPYKDEKAFHLTQSFYQKYYNDSNSRVAMFGINPGRFGAGITGVPFTDPVQLEVSCGIPNELDKREELSSRFVYEVIHAFGGPEAFFGDFYITAVSPLGFMRADKNLNYYDIQNYRSYFDEYVVDWINRQLDFPISRDIAIVIGQGQNLKYLTQINDEYRFFRKIVTVPHPRWVMQYRLKSKQTFIDAYLHTLKDSI